MFLRKYLDDPDRDWKVDTPAPRFNLHRLHALNAIRGIDVKPPPGWSGERMDYSIAIERMLWEQGTAR